MAQCPTPPKYVMFYCETPSASGGETPIILSNEVAEYMKLKHPKFTEKVLAHVLVLPAGLMKNCY